MQNRHHLELSWLEDCVALAQSLNFSRAAASRYVTQPAFSRRIVSLEEWLGTPLFERNRRGVSLTRAGEVFVTQIPELIRALYTLRSESIEAAGETRPDVIFSATHSLSFSFFPALMRNNEKIARFGSFRLLSDTLSACERMIDKGDAQFLLCYYHPHMRINLEQSKYFSVRLGRETLLPYSRCDPATREPMWYASGGKKFPFLSYSAESGLGRILSNTSQVNRARRGMEIAFTADLAATLLAMVRAGDGIAWLPETLAAPDVDAGSIAVAAKKESALWVPIDIRLFRPAAKMSRAVEELWEIFVEDQI
ncbi:LysR family transcriptional regulator [Klebsiella quasipneumoniae subsp. similipneumoniae]|uniref:LysR family transcriptional regulator n=1 Tax=Klebsiella quasipneumoniae TaxID=1463165 RepID=UPI001E58ECAA|nr:LysR family transcriptional regulator [Klebsiella quasipneumoniae]MCD9960304.1 LysR family transcriptional regulator [Klebsiella quasipneumoniae subsp. similipneumoniae]MCE0023855.1 LysR family transcriptional regulator [Klebsiella quasipneumoniae subsp. similipneumoniae]WAI46200.1 LysR family transcriptional regulator [Klebsiella quasipneumoniae]HBQ3473784.1 LysR family transcriptional regulator [Klebsiella quasipneumoniae subsp. similipneumoniae]HBV4011799.1 LysR family transcriptional re